MLLGACIWCLCALSPLLLSGVASISVPLPFSRPSLCLHLFYLCGSRVKSDEEFADDDDELLLSKATGADQKQETSSKLSKVFQLSGFSDPVYAEAYVNVHQYDIHLDGTEVPAFLSTAHSNKLRLLFVVQLSPLVIISPLFSFPPLFFLCVCFFLFFWGFVF